MGTTVTTNLGLIKPDGNEYIQEELPTFTGFATQNSDNCDKIDSLFRHTSHSYTPTWTGDSVNPTLGAGGLVEGKYLRLWPRMVFVFFRIFTGGAGFITGSTGYKLSMPPVAIAPELSAMNTEVVLGKAYLHDDSAAATSTLLVVEYEAGGANVINLRRDAGYWTNAAPFALAQQDRVSGYFMYPTTAA